MGFTQSVAQRLRQTCLAVYRGSSLGTYRLSVDHPRHAQVKLEAKTGARREHDRNIPNHLPTAKPKNSLNPGVLLCFLLI
jgi:hypothetical protein